ncbi:MAG: hypothetical protein DDT26_00667 [Dehalococcoidia bacterium]|nr:hypothetical protein [Chloroflexota bacterium]
MAGYFDLASWYKIKFALQQHHGYPDSSIEDWLPYERDIYVSMIIDHLKEQKERAAKGNK